MLKARGGRAEDSAAHGVIKPACQEVTPDFLVLTVHQLAQFCFTLRTPDPMGVFRLAGAEYRALKKKVRNNNRVLRSPVFSLEMELPVSVMDIVVKSRYHAATL